MKKSLIQILVLLLLIATLASCETLSTETATSPDTSNSYDNPQDEEQDQGEKFLGTWEYSDKNFGETAKELGLKDWPSDSKLALAFSFRPEGTGTYSVKASSNDIVNEEQQEFLWSLDSISPSWILVVMRDNTATNFTMHYESALFLLMNDKDFGKIYFAKQQ